MRPRVSARWFGIVVAALSGLVLLLAVAAPAASAGPAGSRGCGRQASCHQEAKRLAELLAALLAAQQHAGTPTPSAAGKPVKTHVVVHIRPLDSPAAPQDTDDVVVVLHRTMGAQNASSPRDGNSTPAVPTSANPTSAGLLSSLLDSLLGNTTPGSHAVVDTTTGMLDGLLGLTPPTPKPKPSRTEPGPPPSAGSSGGEQPSGQPSTVPPASSSSPRLETAPLQGPSLPPSRGSAVPVAHSAPHHAAGVNLNPVALLSSPSSALLVAAIAAFAVAVFGMVYSAGHRSTGRRHRARRAR